MRALRALRRCQASFVVRRRLFSSSPPPPLVINTHCSYCGTRHVASSYPKQCPSCQQITFINPIPVVIPIVPIVTKKDSRVGVLCGRRCIQPAKGRFSLFGGFLEREEWRQGSCRELQEELGLSVPPYHIHPFWFTSTPRNDNLMLFSVLHRGNDMQHYEKSVLYKEEDLPSSAVRVDGEMEDRSIVFGSAELSSILAFSTHVEAVARFFQLLEKHETPRPNEMQRI